jgi:hypothetical protein
MEPDFIVVSKVVMPGILINLAAAHEETLRRNVKKACLSSTTAGIG